MSVNIKIINANEAIKDIDEKAIRILKGKKENLPKAAFFLQSEIKSSIAGQRAEPTSVDTGRFLNSIDTEMKEESASVFTDVEYACLLGANNSVYNPISKLSEGIGHFKGNYILSKDGRIHKIIKKLRFSNAGKKEIKGIKITASRKASIIITEDHMILTLRNGNLEWIFAKNLNKEDLVFMKRMHNEVIDDSNKTKFVCRCGIEFKRKNSTLKNYNVKYCSIECRHKYGEHNFALGKRWKLKEEQKRYGNKNPAWNNGSSFEPYDWRFNSYLKKIIKKRDKYTCQICMRNKENGNIPYLVIHHKDWNKRNSNETNLITLCPSCHGKQKRIDCSLPEINLNIFKPIKIKKLENVTFKRIKNYAIPNRYDLTIEKEDSFVAGGILIHNSHLEYGTSKLPPRNHFRNSVERSKNKVKEILKG